MEILTTDKGRTTTRQQSIEALRQFYLHYLYEDPIDGTPFDAAVMNALRDLSNTEIKEDGGYYMICTKSGYCVAAFKIGCYGAARALELAAAEKVTYDRDKFIGY